MHLALTVTSTLLALVTSLRNTAQRLIGWLADTTRRLVTANVSSSPAGTESRDTGQATTEYALVMLAAALVALLVVAWATSGGGAGKVGQLFDRILDQVIGRV